MLGELEVRSPTTYWQTGVHPGPSQGTYSYLNLESSIIIIGMR